MLDTRQFDERCSQLDTGLGREVGDAKPPLDGALVELFDVFRALPSMQAASSSQLPDPVDGRLPSLLGFK